MKRMYHCVLCDWDSTKFGGGGLPTRWPSRETVEHFQREHTDLVRGAEDVWEALSGFIEVKDAN